MLMSGTADEALMRARNRSKPLASAEELRVYCAVLERDSRRLGRISIKGQTQKVDVVYGPEYDVAVVYAPLDKDLICIEPQTGPTNCFNLNHEGKYPGLIVLEPGKSFKASFWITPTGF